MAKEPNEKDLLSFSEDEEGKQIEVEVEDEKGSEPAEKEAEPEPQSLSPEDALTELKAQLEGERRMREEAEKTARAQYEAAIEAQNKARSSDLSLLKTAVNSAKQELAIIKSQLIEAKRMQDYEGEVELEEKQSQLQVRLQQLELGRDSLEKSSQQPIRPMPRNVDEVESFASQLSSRSADWIRKNPQFVRDKRLMQKMIAAHNLVVADGVEADTDEYFGQVEGILGLKKAVSTEEQYKEPVSAASAPYQRRSAPPAAPVSRGGGNQKTMRISREEAEMASMMNMTPEEYAKQKQALIKEGKIH